MNGDIYKFKNATSTNQTFIMVLNHATNNCVTIFDNIGNGMTGDITVGYDLNEFELSNILEMSTFIMANN